MKKALAAVAAELATKAKPGWDYLTLRATCDSGFTGHRVTAGPAEEDPRIRHLDSLVALGCGQPCGRRDESGARRSVHRTPD